MRRFGLAVLVWAAVGFALAPAMAQSPAQSAPAQSPPADAAQPDSGTPTVPPPSQTPPPPPAWEARDTAELKVLDRINARAVTVTAKVNEPVQFQTLTITARACVVRPKDQDPDAAAFLEITEASAVAPLFRAWMLVSEPSVSLFEHPLYDIRLVGCHS